MGSKEGTFQVSADTGRFNILDKNADSFEEIRYAMWRDRDLAEFAEAEAAVVEPITPENDGMGITEKKIGKTVVKKKTVRVVKKKVLKKVPKRAKMEELINESEKMEVGSKDIEESTIPGEIEFPSSNLDANTSVSGSLEVEMPGSDSGVSIETEKLSSDHVVKTVELVDMNAIEEAKNVVTKGTKGVQKEELSEILGKVEVKNEAKTDTRNSFNVSDRFESGYSGSASMAIENPISDHDVLENVINADKEEDKGRVIKKKVITKGLKRVKKEDLNEESGKVDVDIETKCPNVGTLGSSGVQNRKSDIAMPRLEAEYPGSDFVGAGDPNSDDVAGAVEDVYANVNEEEKKVRNNVAVAPKDANKIADEERKNVRVIRKKVVTKGPKRAKKEAESESLNLRISGAVEFGNPKSDVADSNGSNLMGVGDHFVVPKITEMPNCDHNAFTVVTTDVEIFANREKEKVKVGKKKAVTKGLKRVRKEQSDKKLEKLEENNEAETEKYKNSNLCAIESQNMSSDTAKFNASDLSKVENPDCVSIETEISISGHDTLDNINTNSNNKVEKTVGTARKKVVAKGSKRLKKEQLGEELGKVVKETESDSPDISTLGAINLEKRNSDVADFNASHSLGVENRGPHIVDRMETEKPNSDLDVSVANDLESVRTNAGKEEKNSDTVSSVEVDIFQEPNVYVRETNDPSTGIPEARISDSSEFDNEENEVEKIVSTSGDMGSGGNKIDEIEPGKVGSEGSGLERNATISDGMALSGEMEALQRRKRRKTEIFVGGLDKDVKEEDLRKVFQGAGELLELTLKMNEKTGKNKGFAFLRYASAIDAKKVLEKFAKVEICGKQCSLAPVEGNDTIYLGNIDKTWKNKDVLKLLQDVGIQKIDKVTVIADPNNAERNRGFAFLELETIRDAQIAFRTLEKRVLHSKHQKIRVAWAEPLNEPDEEDMHKVRSVYAEYLPASWDEERVKDHFKKFGVIENVVLARNLLTPKRRDFAYVNYTTREAALACVEAFAHESLNEESSKIKVSLAKPIPKGKQVKHASTPVSKIARIEKPKATQTQTQTQRPSSTISPVLPPSQHRSMGASASIHYDNGRGGASTTDELVQLLRQQASWTQPQTSSGVGPAIVDYAYTLPSRKRHLSLLESNPAYSDSRGYPRSRTESSFQSANPSGLSSGVGMPSLPNYHRRDFSYLSGSPYEVDGYINSSQTREGAPRGQGSGVYYRY